MWRSTMFKVVTVDESIFFEIILIDFLAFYFTIGYASTNQVQITIRDSHRFMELWNLECNI